jgi:hypothetical protein
MGDTRKPSALPDGIPDAIHIGDFVVRPLPVRSTDDHLDTPQSRDRAVQADDTAHDAQHRAADTPEPATATAQAAADVDASIAEARAAVAAPDDLPFPIVLHDPLTGKPVGSP